MQTEIIHSSPRGMVELIVDKEKYIRRTIYSECLVYDVLKSARSDFIPKIYSVEIADGKTVVCEEYIGGKKLLDIDLTEKQAENVMIQLCSALEDIHKLGIVHRDIKPSNIMIVKDGEIKLIDFEAARFVKEDSEKDTCYLGTEGFAPPEQYGFAQTDFRTDIYAAGQTMKMLLGSFSAKPVYRRIIQRCTLLDPDMRYQSAAELKIALLALRRKPFYFAVGTLLSAATVLALAIGLWPKNSSDHDEFDHIETVTASVQTDDPADFEDIINYGTSSDHGESTDVVVSYDDNGFVYLTDFNEGYRQKPEHIPEYDKDDQIFFCEDRDAKIFLANGKDLFNYFESYTIYTDIDKSGRDECISIGVNTNNLLEISILTPKANDTMQYRLDLCMFTLQDEFNSYDLGEETIVQITCFELDGDNLLAVTVGDKKNYNFTGYFTVKDDEPYYLGKAWGETYARVYGNSLNEYLKFNGCNIYYYEEEKLSAINVYEYNVNGWPYYDDYLMDMINNNTTPEWIYDFTHSVQ